ESGPLGGVHGLQEVVTITLQPTGLVERLLVQLSVQLRDRHCNGGHVHLHPTIGHVVEDVFHRSVMRLAVSYNFHKGHRVLDQLFILLVHPVVVAHHHSVFITHGVAVGILTDDVGYRTKHVLVDFISVHTAAP